MNCTLIAHIAQRPQAATAFGSTFAFFANSQAKQNNADCGDSMASISKLAATITNDTV